MSDFATLVQKPNTEKIILFELDIGQADDFWTNYQAHVWYVNFDNDYPDLEAWMFDGVDERVVSRIGSVIVDSVQIPSVASKADVQGTDPSFHYSNDENALYLRCPDGDDPALHTIVLGLVWGYKKGGTRSVYNNFIYDERLVSVPSLSKSKDPLFFGKIKYEGGTIELDNHDGELDDLAEIYDIFGNAGRLLWGFDDLDYDEFKQSYSGFIETIEIGTETISIQLQDKRKALSAPVPENVFTVLDFPDIKPLNAGKAVPVGWGVMLNTPVICVNEEEGGGPANYFFKLCDTTNHSIDAITAVYVDGVSKTPSSTDLSAGGFGLATADYDPGNEVTADWRGFEDSGGDLIGNGAGVIVDILTSYTTLVFDSNFFNLTEWNQADALDIGLFVNSKTTIINLIEQISASLNANFIVDDDGKYSLRIYDPNAPIVQTITRDEILEGQKVTYDPTEVLSSITVGHSKDWKESEYVLLPDVSLEEEVFEKYKTKRDKTFETLLTNATDAQTFADMIMELSADVQRIFPVKTKTQTLEREVGDFIQVDIRRQTGSFLGTVHAEILGINKNGNSMEVELTCRIDHAVPATRYHQGVTYGDSYYNDAYYCKSRLQIVEE